MKEIPRKSGFPDTTKLNMKKKEAISDSWAANARTKLANPLNASFLNKLSVAFFAFCANHFCLAVWARRHRGRGLSNLIADVSIYRINITRFSHCNDSKWARFLSN